MSARTPGWALASLALLAGPGPGLGQSLSVVAGAASAGGPVEVARPATYEEARRLADARSWDAARETLRALVERDPTRARPWFLLGIVEQRLEHFSASADAFDRGVALRPTDLDVAPFAALVPGLRVQADEQSRRRYSRESTALRVGFDPMVAPGYAGHYDTRLQGFSGGIRNEWGFVNGRFASGSGRIDRITVDPITAGETAYIISGDAKHYLYSFEAGPAFPIVRPYGALGGFALDLPLFAGISLYYLQASGKQLTAMSFDLGAGASATWYTKSPFAIQATAVYRRSFGSFSSETRMTSAGGQDVSSVAGGGLEIGLGILFLLGA